jgi:AAA domain, putative AbiEii toxin, Type IV TA system
MYLSVDGVGKSSTLNALATTIVELSRLDEDDPFASQTPQWQQLSNVVSVSFSAFDAFKPVSEPRDRTIGLPHHYVGLRKKSSKATALKPDSPLSETKGLGALSREMTTAAKTCLVGARRDRWRRALRLLEADPIFASLGVGDLLDEQGEPEEVLAQLPEIFRRLSSGHKIVLLTTTKLVETVEEKSLVLLDEPESHLHPPLLSAFVRALSDLLTDRNGLAIVATHSPVVLQEVPKSCVWKLQRQGTILTAERLPIETFGENVGTLTNEVFGLEVTATGFHTMLADAAAQTTDYQTALAMFGEELGNEGRAILRAMIAARTRGSSVDS